MPSGETRFRPTILTKQTKHTAIAAQLIILKETL